MAVAGWLSKHQTLAAILFLVLALHVCFLPFIWGNKTLLASARGVPSILPDGAFYGPKQGPEIYRVNDIGAASWVTEAFAPLLRHQYLAENTVPLWNPYQAFGAPLAANMQSQPFNPFYALYALSPGPRTFTFFVLCRLLIAGLGGYLYLRLFLSFAPALAGGLVCMLSGYHIMFFDMPHISVEVLLPALFWALERLLRQQTSRNLVLLVAVIFMFIVGGMPESVLLLLSFGYAYFLFRVFSDPATFFANRRRLGYFIWANIAAFALAAFLLLPFAEYLRVSFDTHQVKNIGRIGGIEHDPFGFSIFTYVVPLLFGTAWHTISPHLGGYTALRDFFGILAFLLVLVAIICWRRESSRLSLFFFGSVVVVLLKRYGSPLVNWIGLLPLFEMARFQKYEEPILAFSVAVLCAFGLAQLLGQQVSRKRLAAALSVALLLIVAVAATTLPSVRADHADPHLYYLSLGIATAVLLAAGLLMFGLYPRRKNWLAGLLLVLLLAELAGDYIFPVYYSLTRSATAEENPYRGAPFIDFLKGNTSNHERIFARDRILHPSWAGSFQLADMRDVDAMYYRKYLRFIRSFLHDEVPRKAGADLVDRFTGGNEHAFETPLKRRLLQLASVKYLISTRAFAPDSALVQQAIRQNAGHLTHGRENLIETRPFTIGGVSKTVLYEHPPYERLPLTVEVTNAQRRLDFSIAMEPGVYNGSRPVCGDGVEFVLEARDSSGRISRLFDRYIDPKHNPEERKWIDASVDLGRYPGQRIDLLFTTTPGPAGNSCMDWAGWGDPHFDAGSAEAPVFLQVYDREVKICEFNDRLPRAALFSNVEIAADDEAALARLNDSSLNVEETAVVSSPGLTPPDLEAIRAVNGQPRGKAQGARFLSYRSPDVTIEAVPEGTALLVLNDSDYPGWKAEVDGRPAHWLTANYMFRGVLLPPGRHVVRFFYRPASFVAGAGISTAAALSLAGFVFWRRRPSRVAEADFVQ